MTINVSAIIDRAPVGAFQLKVTFLCALIALLDGLDIQAAALVIPQLRDEWGLPPTAFGPVLSASLAGMALGNMVGGQLGDRFGRRRVLLWSFALVGVSSVATGFAQNAESLIVFRLLTGLGIGGCLPNAIALTTEFIPAKRSGFFVTLMYSAIPLGGIVAGYIASPIIAAFGWPALFFAGGIVPLLLCVVIYFTLPESVRFMANAGSREREIGAILERIDRNYTYAEGDTFEINEARHQGSLRELFTEGRAAVTILLWLALIFSMFAMYMLVSWLPAAFTQLGWEAHHALRSVSYLWFGGIVGGLVAGWLIDRFGAYRVLVPGYVLGGLLTAAIGLSGGHGAQVVIIVGLTGAGVIGSALAITARAANLYPTAIRSTGVGWALGVGRIGAVISPVAGGYALSAQWSQEELFAAAGIPALICAAWVFLLGIAHRRAERAAHGKADHRPSLGTA